MKHEGFGKHGQLGRAELVLPVMADDQMLKQRLHLIRKARDLRNLSLQHFEFDNHVPQQLSARAVRERSRIRELVDLANVVQERTG